MLLDAEKKKMQKAFGVGKRVVEHLEDIGITCLDDLKGQKAVDLAHSIDFKNGGKTIWANHKLALQSLQNVIDLAEQS